MVKHLIKVCKLSAKAPGPSLVLLAAQNGAVDVLKYLVNEHDLELTQKDKHSDDALIFAIKFDRT
jgi:hypothetical protein